MLFDGGDAVGEEPKDADREEELLDALSRGDAGAAAVIFRQLDGLSKATLECLADLLDGDPIKEPSLVRYYPYRLQLTPWGVKGRPRKSARDLAASTTRAMAVSALTRKGKTIKAAIAEVAKKAKKSTSTVRDDRHRLRRAAKNGDAK